MSQVEASNATYAEVSSPPMAKERFAMEENECYGGLKVPPQKNKAASDGNKNVFIVVTIVMLILALAACCIAFAVEMVTSA